MASKLPAFLVGVILLAVLLALPTAAAAQSTFVVPFEATFANPCTAEDVVVNGATTISISDTVTPQGDRRISVSEVTRGTGFGQTFGTEYTFSDNQQFTVKAPMLGEEFDSSFSDKFALKGAKAVDNWVLRAYFRLKISALGEIQVVIERLNADTCKG